jgi:hypothetical protein
MSRDFNDVLRQEGIEAARKLDATATKYQPTDETVAGNDKVFYFRPRETKRPVYSPWNLHSGEPPVPPRWLIKRILPETGTGVIAGQWGTYKTTVALDLSLSIMTGLEFAGRYRVKRHGAVLYLATEGAGSLMWRLNALADYRGITGKLPFAWRPDCPPLTDPDAAEVMCELADQAKAALDVPIAACFIDTLITAAKYKKEGADNDSAAAQMVLNAITALGKHTGAVAIGIDHFGKIVENGTRGSSAKEGAADVVLALLGDREVSGSVKNTVLAVRKLKDGINGLEVPFTPVTIETGTDEDGDPITAVVVDWERGEPTAKKDSRWTKSLQTLRRVLMTMLADHGSNILPFADGHAVRACDLELVRAEFYRQQVADGTDEQKQNARRVAFWRAVNGARDRGIIATREVDGIQYVWLVTTEPA